MAHAGNVRCVIGSSKRTETDERRAWKPPRPSQATRYSLKGWNHMSRHYNTKHPERAKHPVGSGTGYPQRLAERGCTSASVRMKPVDELRKRQFARLHNTGCEAPEEHFTAVGHRFDDEGHPVCHGSPYPTAAESVTPEEVAA